MLYTVLSPDGMLQWFRLRGEVAKLSAENEVLRAENDRLRDEARRLAVDKQEIERAGRKELGYVRQDEVVFNFAPGATGSAKGGR